MFLKKLLIYIKDFRRECILAPLFKLLEASFELIVPLIMAAIIDKGIPGGNTGYIVRMCRGWSRWAESVCSALLPRNILRRRLPSASPPSCVMC